MTSGRPRMRDGDADRSLVSDGYIVLPGAARTLLKDLRGVHRSLSPQVPAGFHSTLYSAETAHKREVHQRILEVLGPLLDSYLEGYRPLLANFVTKGRGGENGVMPPHQDWTFVDEDEGASFNVWIPLVDVDGRNGSISVLPRSHLLPRTIRGTDTTNPFSEVEPDVGAMMVDLPMSAGDVMVHDHRVVHGSPPNRRRRPRVATACAVVADDAQVVHHRLHDDGVLRRYLIDESFFVRHTFGAPSLPPDVVLVGEVDFANPTFDRSDLASIRVSSWAGGAR